MVLFGQYYYFLFISDDFKTLKCTGEVRHFLSKQRKATKMYMPINVKKQHVLLNAKTSLVH